MLNGDADTDFFIFHLAYVYSSYIYITSAVMGMNSKDEVIAGTGVFCAFADLINSPCAG